MVQLREAEHFARKQPGCPKGETLFLTKWDAWGPFFYSTLRTLKNKKHRHEGPRTSHEESWGASSWTSQEILYSPPANSLTASWSDRTLKRVNHKRVIWFTSYWHIKETIYYHEWGWLDSQLFPFWGPGFCVTPKGHVEAAYLDGMPTGVWSPGWK